MTFRKNETKSSLKVSRIKGGTYADIREVPYQAQIICNGKLICGASIIDKYWLVSAAHCFNECKNNMWVMIGSSTKETGYRYDVQSIIVHENYDKITFDNDISLLKLSRPIEPNVNGNVKTILIAVKDPKAGDDITVSGYGEVAPGVAGDEYLKEVIVPIISHKNCRLYFPKVTDNMFCAGYLVRPNDACGGDSGGPAVVVYNGFLYLVGIVSFGKACGTMGFVNYKLTYYPGVYVKVRNYIPWIRAVTNLVI
ncbi:vitamin K-dependent protein C-like [Copidosoma floridanum]|uniref:vitamin K-dependent protein C-like n=1 Tax=Copidosoma floridanum TaxID=29053 RepID=UPI000C6FB076|nr:vitamin K-dependent protein C-like [Copidosoma floridanum]